MTTSWFISDTHFGHRNIIQYCSRPFSSVEEMDEAMIERWNKCVKGGDVVYHIGDFAFIRAVNGAERKEKLQRLIRRLNGQIHLIHGNHDHREVRNSGLFAEVTPYKEIEVDRQKIVLCHYAFKVWNKVHYGAWNLHGHSHGTLEKDVRKQLDMGVDVWGFRPVAFEEVAQVMEKKIIRSVDHHKADL